MFKTKFLFTYLLVLAAGISFTGHSCKGAKTDAVGVATKSAERPNILFAISDDQSFPHASIYGDKVIKTPAFDRIAREGVLFMNAFTASPGCSPSRAALLTIP